MNPQLVGKRIAKRYALRSLIGRGGMGAVYRAQDAKAERDVAIKLIRPEFSSDPKTRRRFNKEARAFAYLKHTNIVEVYDFGQDEDGTLYLSMELVRGTSLRTLRNAQLPLSGILTIVDQLLGALAHAHARGVIHRDLKPENVLVAQKTGTREPIVKLVDFGLASLPALASGSAHQNTGSVIGTPSYMAPEQARGAKGVLGPGTDIYAIGVMLYEILCNKLPYEAEGGIELILKHVQQPVPPLKPREDLTVPADLAKAVHKAMAKRPWDRFVNAADFRRELQKISVPKEPFPRLIFEERPDPDAKQTRDSTESAAVAITMAESQVVLPVTGAEVHRQHTQVIENPEPETSARKDTRSSPSLPSIAQRPRSGIRLPAVVVDDNNNQLKTPPVSETYISSVSFSLGTGAVVGRESEVERVATACERALAGQGQIIVIEGEPGIGKTRLARNIVHRFTETGLMRAAVGLYTATQGDGTNIGLRGALEGIFGSTDMDRSAAASQTRGVLERLGIHDEDDKREMVDFLRTGSDIEHARGLSDGAVRRQRSRLALVQRTVRLIAQEMPLLLLLEDIQWASDSIVGFLESMASSFRLNATPCAVICTLGSDESASAGSVADTIAPLARFEGVHRIPLSRLSDEDIATLIDETLPLDAELTRSLAGRAGGNPFYALQFLHSLRQDERLERDEEAKTWKLRDDVSIESALPSSVADVLRSRIQRTRAKLGSIADAAFELLGYCAVLGMTTDEHLLEAFVEHVDSNLKASLDDALDAWIQAGVLKESANRQADALVFDHGLMREVILEDIPGRKLRRLHKHAATVKRDHFYPFLQPVARDIAEHYRAAGEPGPASEYELLAARAAEAAGNFGEAEGHFTALLELYREQDGADDPELAASKGKSGFIKPGIDWSEVWLGLGRIAIAQGDYDKATTYVEELAAYAEQRGLLLAMGRSNWLLGRIATRRGQLVDAWDHFGTARDLFEAEEDMLGVAQALWGIGQVAQLSGWLNEARQWLEEAREIYEANKRPIDVAGCLVALGSTALSGGLLNEARQHYELARATFEGARDRYNVNYCLLGQALVESESGDQDAAIELLRKGLEAFVNLGDRHGQIDSLNRLGLCYMRKGEHRVAQQYLSEARAGYKQLDARHGLGHNLRLQGTLLRMRGEPTEAVQFLRQALDHITEAGDRQGQAACYLELARIAVDLDDLDRAETQFTEAHELYTISSDAIGIATCAEVFAMIQCSRGLADDGVAAAEEGLAVAEQTGARPVVARLLVTAMLGTALADRHGDLRRLGHALDELDIELVNIRDPLFVRSLRQVVDAIGDEGVDADLRGLRQRLATQLS